METIREFLHSVRRKLLRRTALKTGIYVAAGLLGAAVLAPLMALSISAERGTDLGVALAVIAGLGVCASVYVGVWRPIRRWRDERSVARYVGGREPEVASDLLSAVELAETKPNSRAVHSRGLVDALIRSTATRIEDLDNHQLIPPRELKPAKATLAAAALTFAAALLFIPGSLAEGWERLSTPPASGPYGGARLSNAPLVGDLDITLTYPLYTNRPKLTLPQSSGDFRAMPGTIVEVNTRALVPATAARILFGEPDDESRAPVLMTVDGSNLRARFTVTEPGVYRFMLESGRTKKVEATPHVIEIQPDKTPEVQLYAPAEELDVTNMKRVELAYIAEDDFGIAKVELVWTIDGKPERKELPLGDSGRRSAQSKFLWDLADLGLKSGARVEYHVEVTDNDSVLGPNVGKSKSFRLKVFSPRERHEAMIDRQAELFEKMVRLLGGRLVIAPGDIGGHRKLHTDTKAAVLEIGGIISALEDNPLAAKKLPGTLRKMRARLQRLIIIERRNLALSPGPTQTARLGPADKKHVVELENDVLILANWIDRQRMEALLAITDEIKNHRRRLKDLFKELKRTGSEEIKKEIERELRALERKLAELAQKRGRLNADVLDRFVNQDAMKGDKAKSCVSEVRELVRQGKADEAAKKMEQCSNQMAKAAQAMEDALSQLRSDKFSEQEKKLGELMNNMADLTQDQKDIASAADKVWDRYKKRAAEAMKHKAKETRKKLSKTIEKLRTRLKKIPKDGLTSFSKEELDVVKKRLDDLDAMLADGDIAEALSMAKQAKQSLDTMDAELEHALDADKKAPWRKTTERARKAVQKATPLAKKLVKELESATPSPKDIMSKADRQKLRELRQRQMSVRERSRRLAEKAKQMAKDLPGRAGQVMRKGIQQAGEHMKRAEKMMKRRDPSGSRLEARQAADALDKTRKRAQGAARQQQQMGRGLRDEPVRIPGADKYKAPEKFREELLEAMKKEKAPDGFSDLVRRYYQELIK